MAEIVRTAEVLNEWVGERGIDLLLLHGDLSDADQERALAPSDRRKVISSTNIAESPLTIEGIQGVVDTGFARVLRHDSRYGVNRLERVRISKASAAQRAAGAVSKATRQYTKLARCHEAKEKVKAPNEPELLRLLLKRYPKHDWPENPLEALPSRGDRRKKKPDSI
ncbi:MAG: hypothetical protein KJ645_00280 [Planctomycetes bacterium]|nr:hypothetical protein [Planctomycetota bacterium]